MKAVKFLLIFQLFFGLLSGSYSQTKDWKKEITAGRYAPPGMYMKDHCLIFKNGIWHLFAPFGSVGTMWHYEGSEESAGHMISVDLIHWKYLGTAVASGKKDGYFDRIMSGLAPSIVKSDDKYYMFYSGWDFKSKNPLNFEGFRQGIGVAVSRDLVTWEKPERFAKDGLAPKGSDPCVVKDKDHNRWLLFCARSNAVALYESKDLFHWSEVGMALDESDLKIGMTGMNPGESPFVMRHPLSGKWIIFMNGGYSVSDDPLSFPQIIPYPFKSGIYTFKKPHDEGKGTFYYAEEDGSGFAHEIIEFNGQWYITGVVGTDGHTRLKFTPIQWTEDAFRLAE